MSTAQNTVNSKYDKYFTGKKVITASPPQFVAAIKIKMFSFFSCLQVLYVYYYLL